LDANILNFLWFAKGLCLKINGWAYVPLVGDNTNKGGALAGRHWRPCRILVERPCRDGEINGWDHVPLVGDNTNKGGDGNGKILIITFERDKN
jgi:hypothetical protein